MLKQALLNEFEYEAENTRKLLKAIPDSAMDYKPQPHLWSLGQLAQHVANIYSWFDGTFNYDKFDINTLESKKYELTSANILNEFEENYKQAKEVLENSDESKYFNDWSLVSGEQTLIGPAPKAVMARGFLYNHLYHHRGEIVAHLRTTGNRIPGLYGPTYEDLNP